MKGYHNPRVGGSSPSYAKKSFITNDLTFRLTRFARSTPLAQFFLSF